MNNMSDLQKYIKKRKDRDATFARGFDAGYRRFKARVMRKQARQRMQSGRLTKQ